MGRFFSEDINGFELGYIISDNGDDAPFPALSAGQDGIIIVVASAIGAGVALHYFNLFLRGVQASPLVVAAGTVVTVVGAYNFLRIVDELRSVASLGDALGAIHEGLYLVMAGGLIMTIAGVVGWRRNAPPPV